jgi:uncharacterized protein YkwD
MPQAREAPRPRCSHTLVLTLLALACFACATPGLPVPSGAASYSTDPQSGGVPTAGEGERLASEIEAALRERGDSAKPDGALAKLGAWGLDRTEGAKAPGGEAVEEEARRLGFMGELWGAAYVPMSGPDREAWRQSLATIPRNMPVTRYGVAVRADGRVAAVFWGAVEAELSPIPRRVAVGTQLSLSGEVSKRFRKANVFVTAPDGAMSQRNFASRSIDTELELDKQGRYKLEVMGDGPSGPVVLVNVPIYVGIEPPLATGEANDSADVVLDPAAFEAELLELLNGERKKVGLRPLVADDALRAIALAHTEDMSKNHFFGHVSPTTGSPGDRMKRAGILVSASGENIGAGGTPRLVHNGLMESPGHRENMLNRDYNHVGIAAVPGVEGEQMFATFVFGRRPDPNELRSNRAAVVQTISALRKKKGLGPIKEERYLQGAAQAGIQEVRRVRDPKQQHAVAGANRYIVSHPLPPGSPGGNMCMLFLDALERSQLADTMILSEDVKRYGIEVFTRDDARPGFIVFAVLSAAPGDRLECR